MDLLNRFFYHPLSENLERNAEHQAEHDNSTEPFPFHRRLLRRRHVRKIQKAKERERQRMEDERKLQELDRVRDRKRRVEKTRALRNNEMASNAKSRGRRTVYSTGTTESPVHEGYYIKGATNNRMKVASYCTTSPTSVMGLHRSIASTTTLLSPYSGLPCYATGYTEGDIRCRSSFSLPEFTPVRPTKFRKLQF